MDDKTRADTDLEDRRRAGIPMRDLMPDIEPAGPLGLAASAAASNFRRSTPGAGRISRPTGAAIGRCGYFMIVLRADAVRRIHRQRQAAVHPLRRQELLSGLRHLSRHRFRRRSRHRRRLSRSLSAKISRRASRHRNLAADPVFLQHHQRPATVGFPVQADLAADPGRLRFRRQERLCANAARSK